MATNLDATKEPIHHFDLLVSALRDKLGPSSGIDDDDVDIDELQSLMRGYRSKESEWQQYAFGVPNKPYTRNLVDKGNGKYNLVSQDL
jgi:cysteine dioxygenase